jgi:hypothetical protein
MNKFSKEKKSRMTNSVSSNEHASRQQRTTVGDKLGVSAGEMICGRESVSCCVTFAHYTSLLEFAVPSLEFHCVLWFFNILLNKKPMEKIISGDERPPGMN